MSESDPSPIRAEYESTSPRPTLPPSIEAPGLLIGWSLEEEARGVPVGFSIGDPVTHKSSSLIDPILFEEEGHLLTIASTGAGKGIGCIVPALLTHKGPMVVIDPKGENAAITARYRESLGQKVHIVDPMQVITNQPAAFNPLDGLDPKDPMCVDEVAAIAQILGAHLNPDTRNAYWVNRGRHLVSAVILHTISLPEESERTLATVRKILSEAQSQEGKFLYDTLRRSPNSEARAAAGSFNISANETLSAIISMGQDMVDFVRGEPVRTATSTSDFSLDEITRGDPATIYFVLPPHMLESHGQLLRLWVSTVMRAISRRRARPKIPTMLLLDEAAQLGEFAPLRQAVTLLRGYGLQTWSFWQDVSQLKQCFPTSWRTIINNCRVVQAFGAPNMSAARSIAELFDIGRPDTILDLESNEIVVQVAGKDAFIARRPNYLVEPPFAGKFDPNPFYSGGDPLKAKPRPIARRSNTSLRRARPQTDEAIAEDLLRRFG